MTQVSKDDLSVSFAGSILQGPGETASSSAEVQLDKGYAGRRCANGADGPRRISVCRGRFFSKIIGHLSYA